MAISKKLLIAGLLAVVPGCQTVLGDYGFEIRESNRYDGHIETIPRIAPGLGLFLKPGSPDLRDRLLATLQTYRHRVLVDIQPACRGQSVRRSAPPSSAPTTTSNGNSK
jgi:hypothetical protein